MSVDTPCSTGNPDDWFIGRDGKQYPDDELVSGDAALAILEEANEQGLEGEARSEFIDRAQDRAEADAKKAALRRRRHAKEKCHTECYFRTRCLEVAIQETPSHGTWGGYYEEELREIHREINRRRRSRAGG